MNRTQLADAMLKGLKTPNVREETMAYVKIAKKTEVCMACAMGCALIGHYDGDYRHAEIVFDQRAIDGVARLLGISYDLAIEIEHRHLNGQTIEQIAAWLKSSEGEVKTNV